MANTAGAGAMTGKPLIESDRVEGTTVYDPNGSNIGSIKRLMIEKISGRVAYAVMSFGGFLGMGEEEHAVPWNKLAYDTSLGGYRTDVTEQQLRGAPAFARDGNYDWSGRSREKELHDFLGMQVFGIVIILGTATTSLSGLTQEVMIAAPALIAGTFLGLALFGRVNENRFRAAILVLLLVSGGLMMR